MYVEHHSKIKIDHRNLLQFLRAISHLRPLHLFLAVTACSRDHQSRNTFIQTFQYLARKWIAPTLYLKGSSAFSGQMLQSHALKSFRMLFVVSRCRASRFVQRKYGNVQYQGTAGRVA